MNKKILFKLTILILVLIMLGATYYNHTLLEAKKAAKLYEYSLMRGLAQLQFYESEKNPTIGKQYLITAEQLLSISEEISTIYNDQLSFVYGKEKVIQAQIITSEIRKIIDDNLSSPSKGILKDQHRSLIKFLRKQE